MFVDAGFWAGGVTCEDVLAGEGVGKTGMAGETLVEALGWDVEVEEWLGHFFIGCFYYIQNYYY